MGELAWQSGPAKQHRRPAAAPPAAAPPAAVMAVAADADSQVLVQFFTKLPSELRVPETEVVSGTAGWPRFLAAAARGRHGNRVPRSLLPRATPNPPRPRHPAQAVPSSLKRYGLSQVINHLLALGAWQGVGVRRQCASAVGASMSDAAKQAIKL